MNLELSKVNCLGKIKILAEKLFQCHIVHWDSPPPLYRNSIAYSMTRWSNFRSMFKQVIRNKEVL